MSDVPVTAFWTLALVLAVSRRTVASGLAMAVAIAIRPNLAPLAAVIGIWTWITTDRAGRRRALVGFAGGVAPAIIGIAWLNGTLYESPFVSGYGTTGDLYSLGNFAANVSNYARWIAEAETPVVALAAIYVAAPGMWMPPRLPHARALIGATIAVALLSYVFFQPFHVWWFLRYLLPMWPVTMLATCAAIDGLARRAGPRMQPIIVTAIIALLASHHLQFARAHSAFDLGRSERKYVDVARFVADHTEPDAVMLSQQHSGSLRLYAGRLTLRYDVLDSAWLDRSLAALQSSGRHPYLVLDGDEVEMFRRRFSASSRAGALDWSPIATLNGIVNIYDPLQREAASPLAIASTRGSRGLLGCDAPYSRPPVRRMK